MILTVFRVSGHSMIPTLKPDDRLLATSIPYYFNPPKKGDLVIVKDRKTGKILVKRITEAKRDSFKVEGDNRSDSLKMDPVKRNDILGKVIFTFKY